MFENLITYPIESPLLQWESKIVVRDHEREARLYLRLKLTGTTFPILNSIPFVQAGKVKARFVDIADDGLSVTAYFDTAPPNEGASPPATAWSGLLVVAHSVDPSGRIENGRYEKSSPSRPNFQNWYAMSLPT